MHLSNEGHPSVEASRGSLGDTPQALEAFAVSERARAEMMRARANAASLRSLAAHTREEMPEAAAMVLAPRGFGGAILRAVTTQDGTAYPKDWLQSLDTTCEGVFWDMARRSPAMTRHLPGVEVSIDIDTLLDPPENATAETMSADEDDEQTYLVAVTVTTGNRQAGHLHLHNALASMLTHPQVESWWVAEPDRRDGSDCANAVFTDDGPHGQRVG